MLLFVAPSFAAPPATNAPAVPMPIRNLRLPVKLFPDGKVQVQFMASSALVPPRGAIVATEARIEVFDARGQVQAVLTAEDLRFDRESGKAHSDARVRMERGPLVITGRGLDWDMNDASVRVLSRVEVVYTQTGAGGGGRGLFPLLPGGRGQ